jgi:hypothetical protein
MKKLYTLILLSIATLSSKAQYTLTTANEPSLGDVEYTWNADTAGVQNGSAGAGQSWNYTTLTTGTNTIKTTSYVAVSSVPNGTAFPGANLAQTSDGTNFNMWNYGATNITLWGATNPTLTILFSNAELVLYLPFTYLNANTDTYASTFSFSGITANQNGTVTTNGDAYGTLNMPGGNSFPNTLRIKLTSVENNTYTGSVSATETVVANSYIYFNSASKNAMLTIENSLKTTKSGTTTTVVKDKKVTINNAAFVGIKESVKNSNFSISPNPSSNKEINLSFLLLESENYTAIVYNALGQEVKTMNFGELCPERYSIKMDLHDLNSGLYYLKLKGNTNEGIQKIILE